MASLARRRYDARMPPRQSVQVRDTQDAELSRFEFATSSPAEAAAFLRSVYSADRSRVLDPTAAFRFESGFVQNGKFSLEYLEAVGRGSARVRSLGTVTIVLIARGEVCVAAGGEHHVLVGGDMVALGSDISFDIEWSDPMVTVARLEISEMERVATRATGLWLDTGRFLRRASGSAQATHLRATLDYMRRHVLSNPAVARNSFVRACTTEMLAAAVLNTFGENDADRAVGRNATPVVQRACRFMDVEASSAITIDDVAKAARVSKRTLQASFKRHLGVTPSQYLASARLAGARRELRAEDPTLGVTVDQVMRAWHFSNAGRFAKLYRETYSELPKTTLSR